MNLNYYTLRTTTNKQYSGYYEQIIKEGLSLIKLKSKKEFNELLVKEGYSKRSFARKSDLSESTIIQISNEKQSPRPENAKKICEALERGFDDIFIIEEAKQVNVV